MYINICVICVYLHTSLSSTITPLRVKDSPVRTNSLKMVYDDIIRVLIHRLFV